MNHQLTQEAPAVAPGPTPSLLETLEQAAGVRTQTAEDAATQLKADLRADLETKALHWIARGREANVELGRVFNQLKLLVEHGEWEAYFAATFEPLGVAFRTGQQYMKMAREADEAAKNANSALFPPATDEQATAVTGAVEQAEQDVEAATNAAEDQPAPLEPKPTKTKKPRKKPVRMEGIYQLPLHMTGDEKDATDELIASQNWGGAAMELMAVLRRLHVKYGIVNDPAAPATDQPRERVEVQDEPNPEPYPGADEDMADAEDVVEEEPEYENTLA